MPPIGDEQRPAGDEQRTVLLARGRQRSCSALLALMAFVALVGGQARVYGAGVDARPGGATAIAVLDIPGESAGLEGAQLASITDWVRDAAQRFVPNANVFTRENVQQILEATGRDLAQCVGDCEVETGRLLGADYVVTGVVAKFATTYVLTLKIHDTRSNRFLGAEKAQAKAVDGLLDEVERASRRLFTRLGARGPVSGDAGGLVWSGPSEPVPILPGRPVALELPRFNKGAAAHTFYEGAIEALERDDFDEAEYALLRATDDLRRQGESIHPNIRYYQARAAQGTGKAEAACERWRHPALDSLGERRGEIRLQRLLCEIPLWVRTFAAALARPLRTTNTPPEVREGIWRVLHGVRDRRWFEIEPSLRRLVAAPAPAGPAAEDLLSEVVDHFYGFDPLDDDVDYVQRGDADILRRIVTDVRTRGRRDIAKVYGELRMVRRALSPGFFEELPPNMAIGLVGLRFPPGPARELLGALLPLAAEVRPVLEIDWVRLRGGHFGMGRPDAGASDRDGPVHAVVIEPFLLSRTEVTVAQYAACIQAGVCDAPAWDSCQVWVDGGWQSGKSLPARFRAPELPVVCVSWSQARRFAEWVGGRLPTEAEWEYAARSAGRGEAFPWGTAPVACERAIVRRGEGADGCGRGSPWPPCSRPGGNTAQGLCDMVGNVFEWTEDCWHPTYQGAPRDGTARSFCASPKRVARGGAYNVEDPDYLTTTFRSPVAEDDVRDYLGFRVAR